MNKLIDSLLFIFIISIYIFSGRENLNLITNILALIIVALISIEILLNRRKIVINSTIILMLTFIFICLASLFWAKDESLVVKRSITIMLNFIIMFMFIQYINNTTKIKFLLKSFIYAGVISTFYVIRDVNINNISRSGEILGNLNSVGIYLSISICISLYLIIYMKKSIYILPCIFSFIGMLLTGSRTALLLSLLMLISMNIVNNSKKTLKIILSIIIGIIILIISYKIIIKNEFFYNIIGIRVEQFLNLFNESEFVDTSTLIRKGMIEEGIVIFKNNLFIGCGLDNYRIVSSYGTYSHNNYIELLTNLGVLGFFVYYYIFILLIKKIISKKTEFVGIKILLIVLLIALLIVGVSSVQYYQKYIFLILALASSFVNIKENTYTRI